MADGAAENSAPIAFRMAGQAAVLPAPTRPGRPGSGWPANPPPNLPLFGAICKYFYSIYFNFLYYFIIFPNLLLIITWKKN
jgi:hypothetical protein